MSNRISTSSCPVCNGGNLISIEDLAERWHVSSRTIRRLLAQRKIKHTYVAGRVRFSEVHIAEYLEGNEIERFDWSKVKP